LSYEGEFRFRWLFGALAFLVSKCELDAYQHLQKIRCCEG